MVQSRAGAPVLSVFASFARYARRVWPALLCCLLAVSCGGAALLDVPEGLLRDGAQADAPALPPGEEFGGPLRRPVIPADLEDAAAEYALWSASFEEADTEAREELRYSLELSCPEDPELERLFRGVSLLEEMRSTPPEGMTALEQRLAEDLDKARALLSSRGYYEGRAWGRIAPVPPVPPVPAEEAPEEPWRLSRPAPRRFVARLRLRPGARYAVGASSVRIIDAEGDLARGLLPLDALRPERDLGFFGRAGGRPGSERRSLRSLGDVGLPDGAPALAEDILNAVSRAQTLLRNNGHPFAEVSETVYTLDYEHRVLNIAVALRAGPLCRMGELRLSGEWKVEREYIENLLSWRKGQLWSENALERFSSALRESGLFQSVEAEPAPQDDGDGTRAVLLQLAPAPERTASVILKYNSDLGPGFQAAWTHRNLSGRGDRLSLEAPLWRDMQVFSVNYRLPFFGDKSQDFVAQGGGRNEKADAYSLSALSSSAGLERRFSRRVSGGARLSFEAGSLETPSSDKRAYRMFGIPLNLSYSDTDSALDPGRGFKALVRLTPYAGTYRDHFRALRGRAELSVYLPLLPERRLALALRGALGSVLGADSERIPATIRFYGGGGGSVRGYAYQSLGPRDADDKPLGGASMTESGAELRLRLGEDWGLAAFVDGGMVYPEYRLDLKRPLLWGAGLGARYYTQMGPLRLDIATPLNRRDDDKPFQIYISIGQSF